MTRINVVPPAELSDRHLMAEFRELTRIPNGIASGKLQWFYPDAPADYVLGPGHVKFFCGRLPYLARRYAALVIELQRRGFNINPIWPATLSLEGKNYRPTENALALNRARIQERTSHAGMGRRTNRATESSINRRSGAARYAPPIS